MANEAGTPFTPTRVAPGETVNENELIKRLAYQLQVPATTFGKRLLKVYKAVIEDALEHGEGINLGSVIVRLKEFDNRYHHATVFGGGQKRSRMYKYIMSTTDSGRDALERITKENYGGN